MKMVASGPTERLKNVLTERALDTATAYWLELRGNMFVEYMSRFTTSSTVRELGWEKFMFKLLTSPPEEVVVTKLVKKRLGGSGTNPYLKDKAVVSYMELVEPAMLGRRLLDIRSKLAEDLITDLQLQTIEDERLIEAYSAAGKKEAQEMALNWVPVVDTDVSNAETPYRVGLYYQAVALTTDFALRKYQAELRIRGDRYTQQWLDDRFAKSSSLNKLQQSTPVAKLQQGGNDLIRVILEGPMVLVADGKDRSVPKVVQPLTVAKEVMAMRAAYNQEMRAHLAEVGDEQRQLVASVFEKQLRNKSIPPDQEEE